MALSKKHYEQFAYRFAQQVERVVRVHGPRAEGNRISNVALSHLEELAGIMAVDFALDNPRFDRERFMAACGF